MSIDTGVLKVDSSCAIRTDDDLKLYFQLVQSRSF